MRERLEYEGRVLLNTRINLYNGHPPPTDVVLTGVDFWRGHDERWHVVRHEAKKPIWAVSTHGSAFKQHQVNYHLVATHKATGTVVKATVWKCSRRASSEIRILKKPNGPTRRCWMCSKFPSPGSRSS